MVNDFEHKFQKCLLMVFKEKSIYENISEIDSITYVELIVVIQNEFNIKFNPADIATLRTIDKLKYKTLTILNITER